MQEPVLSSLAEPRARSLSLPHPISLLTGLLILLSGLIVMVAPTDPDVWWHLRNGQLIWEHGVPHVDLYSYTAAGRTWLAQEWLTEVGMHGLKVLGGFKAVALAFVLVQVATGWLFYRLARFQGARRSLALGLLILFLGMGMHVWGVRPQALTFPLIGLFLLVLLGARRKGYTGRALWGLPVLTLLWCNLHASFIMGIVLVGLFLAGEIMNRWLYRPQPAPALLPLAGTLLACLLVSLINPYFIELWSYPLTYLLHGTANPLLRNTVEWQSPNFHAPYYLIFFGGSLLMLAVTGLAEEAPAPGRPWRLGLTRRLDTTDVFICALFTLMGLQAIRFIPLYGMLVLPLFAARLVRLYPWLSAEQEPAAPALDLPGYAVVALCTMFSLVILIQRGPLLQWRDEPATGGGRNFPVAAVDYLEQLHQPVRMFNQFVWGGYLIYRLYPRQLVFIDGRADMYREGLFDAYMAVEQQRPGWREVLRKHQVNLALVESDGPIAAGLAGEKAWRQVYRDQRAVIFRLQEK